jgi:RHS repeat-associated protein
MKTKRAKAPSLRAGATYKIRLHWATFSDDSAGQRSINVLINGAPALSHFDVFAAAGGDLKAVVREFSGSADGAGNLVVAITADAGFPLVSAFLNALEVLVPTQSALDINSGGSGVPPFLADTASSGGSIFSVSTTVSTSGVTDPAPMAVYQTVRFGNFSYTIPSLTPSASYTVRLHFAEIFWSTTGQRVFNVAINGTTVLTSFDIIAAAGSANQAVIREFTATADGSGNIGVTFTTVVDNAMVNGIEVLGGAPAGLTTFRYDPNGNLLTATDGTGTTIYAWDSENRLLSVASPLNGTETYTYASDGMRRQKVTSAQTTNFVWDGQNVLQERSVTNVRLAQYTDYPGMWGGLAAQRQGSTSSFYAFDSQSSTRILVSAGGVITDSYSYKAFGEELAQGTSPQAEYNDNPFQYVGQYGYYRDLISRLKVRARELDTSNGRWISRDPLGFEGTDSNLYRYVMNHSLAAMDPSGLTPVSIGPVPPGKTCPKGADAITGCNVAKGKPYTLICDTGCDAACTDAHEGQHRSDITACCAKYKNCLDAAHTFSQKQICILKWQIWFSDTRNRTECQAYRSGLLCRQHMAKNMGCYDKIKNNNCDDCCMKVVSAIERDNTYIQKYCKGSGWPRLKATPCPF